MKVIIDGKEYVEVKKEEKIIYAPDFVSSKEIMFNDYNQCLYVADSGAGKKIYLVERGFRPQYLYRWKHKLIPIKREDLEPGDVAYGSDYELSDFKGKESYFIILNEEQHVCVEDDESTSVEDDSWDFWFKVVAV